jgi:cytochrome c oxidase assembly protein subunit 15
MFDSPWWRNFFENTLTVQFDHRMLAYGIFVIALLHLGDVLRTRRGGVALVGAMLLASAVTVQATLGILTLLHQAPLALALAHQGVAMLLLTVTVVYAARLNALSPVAARGAAPPPVVGGVTRITLPRAPVRDRR